MAGAGSSASQTTTNTPSDSQFAAITKTDLTTQISASDSEFTTPSSASASSTGSGSSTITAGGGNTDEYVSVNANSGAYRSCGNKFTTGHPAIGVQFDKVGLYLRKIGSPTGTGYLKHISTTDTVLATLASIDVSTISASKTLYEFSGLNFSIAANEKIIFEFNGGDLSNRISVYGLSTGNQANINGYNYHNTSGWINETTGEAYQELSYPAYGAGNVKDDKSNPTTLRQKTNSEVAPWVKADMGSAVEMLGVAVHFHSDTDITSFKIETSADDSTYTRRKTIPYTLITEGAWNIILFPRPPIASRYLKITGLDAGAKTLSINEIAVLVLTESVINRRHRIITYDPSTSCLTLTGA